MASIHRTTEPLSVTEQQIALALRYKHGEQTAMLPSQRPDTLLSAAIDRGFIDTEGYITRKGRALIARYSFI